MISASHHFPVWLHRLTAVLGMLWVLVLGGLAVRPDWHEALCDHHSDAAGHSDDLGHEDEAGCVVTRFAHGQVLAASEQVLVFEGLQRWFAAVPVDNGVAVVAERELPPSCGPPAA